MGDRPFRWVVNSGSALGRYDREGATDPDGFGVEEREECTYIPSTTARANASRRGRCASSARRMFSLNSAAGVDPGKAVAIAGRIAAASMDARAALTAATSAEGPRPPTPRLEFMGWVGVEKRLKGGVVSPVGPVVCASARGGAERDARAGFMSSTEAKWLGSAI